MLVDATPADTPHERSFLVIDPPQITETADQLIAFIPLVVPRDEIQAVMGPAIRELYSALAAQPSGVERMFSSRACRSAP